MSNVALRLPSPDDAQQAREALRLLSSVKQRGPQSLQVVKSKSKNVAVTVPKVAFDLFLEMLGHLANGTGVSIVRVHAELTTQQAADMLNVSRPFLVKLLETGAIPHRKVGAHRRILTADIMAYKQADDGKRSAVLDELAAEAQTHGLGYGARRRPLLTAPAVCGTDLATSPEFDRLNERARFVKAIDEGLADERAKRVLSHEAVVAETARRASKRSTPRR